jgi:Family of unknown function (DUF6188)
MTELAWLHGLEVHSIRDLSGGHYWEFRLGESTFFNVAAPWRILVDGRIQIAGCDHGQQFGLPEKVDVEREGTAFLRGRRIVRAVLAQDTADVSLFFDGDRRLDVFNESSGYEGWQLKGHDGRLVVALGGGKIAEWGPQDA